MSVVLNGIDLAAKNFLKFRKSGVSLLTDLRVF